jgi:hypothetical protein
MKKRWRGAARLTVVLLLPALLAAGRERLAAQPDRNYEIASSRELKMGSAVLQVDFAAGQFDLGNDAILQHVQAASNAVATYYGQFPVKRARVLVVPVEGGRGQVQGTTWGDMHGWQGFTRLRIDQHITAADLADDWTTTHELVHMAFPSLPDDQHWMEEGLATYVEPIARVETGELKAEKIWRDMVRDMPKGEPQEGDRGMDRTHTWGRTYWGGALFCLVADVEIRRETKNHKGLQDALRAIVAQGGTIDQEWSLDRALAVGDGATGTHVLTSMYTTWKDSPSPVDLDRLWGELGIKRDGNGIQFVAGPLSDVREAIAKEAGQRQQAGPVRLP